MFDDYPGSLGALTEAAGAALAELGSRNAIARLWAGDHTLWRDEPTEIHDRLGWLTIVPEMMANIDTLRSQCSALAGDVDHVLLMGMGGSSLFPEVLARLTPSGDRPRLHVLDTTHPAVIARLDTELPPERTLHLAASKSGTTLETRSHLEWAWARFADAAHFGVITDPGSELDALAEERGFAAIWRNRPDIGGRYSALSYFGLVPGMLTYPAGVDGLLVSASMMAERLRGAVPANQAARLAAVLAAGVRAGHDKLTLLLPTEFDAFGLWLEQLLAESTGKDGTGVVPVVGEPLGEPEDYGNDRLFVGFGSRGDGWDGDDRNHGGRLDRLVAAGHPLWIVPWGGVGDLGGQVLLWEVATALCGALLGIQPFDQPDVAAAKTATDQVLANGLPDSASPHGSIDGSVPLQSLLDTVTPGDYLAVQAFVDPEQTGVIDSDLNLGTELTAARTELRDKLRVATTVGLGPRFLHSTGQLHKGGPDSGVFVQVIDESTDGGAPTIGPVVPIPAKEYDFGTLFAAQAAGDLLTLQARDRRVARVDVAELLRYTRRSRL